MSFGSWNMIDYGNINKYLASKTDEVQVKTNLTPIIGNLNNDGTVSLINEAFDRGDQVIIDTRFGYSMERDNNVFKTTYGGHSMYVVDTTSDGKIVVASWGDRYDLEPGVWFDIITINYEWNN